MKCLALFLLSIMILTPLQAKPTVKIIDLTYSFDADSVYWPTAETFKLETDFEGVTDKGYFYSAYRFSAAEHGKVPECVPELAVECDDAVYVCFQKALEKKILLLRFFCH